jgi:hypothetical protein
MTQFTDYCERLQRQYGERFSDVGLSQKFRPYFQGQRIKVRFGDGEVKTGIVSGTTGWRPSLMLMLTRRSTGSVYLLHDRHEIIGIKCGKGYRSV